MKVVGGFTPTGPTGPAAPTTTLGLIGSTGSRGATGSTAPPPTTTMAGPKFPLTLTGFSYILSLSDISIIYRNVNVPGPDPLELIDEATGKEIPLKNTSTDKTLRKVTFKPKAGTPPFPPIPDMNTYNNFIRDLQAAMNNNTTLSRTVLFSLQTDQGEFPTPLVNPVAPGTPLPDFGSTTTKGGPKCTPAFNKSMMDLNTVMTDVLGLHKKLIDVRNSFAQYRDPNGLGCMTMKGGKRSRKNRKIKGKAKSRRA